ncbi:hypothetical protein J6590_035841 [Homalodisca vitripennis]|nr:hypothetical protein J6590_035841 [Homalodisca vitripennis]
MKTPLHLDYTGWLLGKPVGALRSLGVSYDETLQELCFEQRHRLFYFIRQTRSPDSGVKFLECLISDSALSGSLHCKMNRKVLRDFGSLKKMHTGEHGHMQTHACMRMRMDV